MFYAGAKLDFGFVCGSKLLSFNVWIEMDFPLVRDKVSLVDRYQGYYLCSMGQTLLLEQV